MTLGGIAFVVSWVPPFAVFFRDSGVNWVAIISGALALGFAYWVIIDLYIKLKSKPMLLVRSSGGEVIVHRDKQSFPIGFQYFYNVSIVNSSPDKTLGIIDIELQVKYKNKTKHILLCDCVPPSDFCLAGGFGLAAERLISSPTIWLQPNESKECILAFVEEHRAKEELLSGGAVLPDLNIVITDAQKRRHIFPATMGKMGKFPQGKIIK